MRAWRCAPARAAALNAGIARRGEDEGQHGGAGRLGADGGDDFGGAGEVGDDARFAGRQPAEAERGDQPGLGRGRRAGIGRGESARVAASRRSRTRLPGGGIDLEIDFGQVDDGPRRLAQKIGVGLDAGLQGEGEAGFAARTTVWAEMATGGAVSARATPAKASAKTAPRAARFGRRRAKVGRMSRSREIVPGLRFGSAARRSDSEHEIVKDRLPE